MLERGSPPSTYAILALLEGEPGALGRVAVGTAQRMVLIAPGLWLAGFRGRDLLAGTAAASASVTLGLIAYYALNRR